VRSRAHALGGSDGGGVPPPPVAALATARSAELQAERVAGKKRKSHEQPDDQVLRDLQANTQACVFAFDKGDATPAVKEWNKLPDVDKIEYKKNGDPPEEFVVVKAPVGFEGANGSKFKKILLHYAIHRLGMGLPLATCLFSNRNFCKTTRHIMLRSVVEHFLDYLSSYPIDTLRAAAPPSKKNLSVDPR
jgi:hypothetical protein